MISQTLSEKLLDTEVTEACNPHSSLKLSEVMSTSEYSGMQALSYLWDFVSIVEQFHKTNFVLATNPKSFSLYHELTCIIDLIKKFKELEISQLTPSNAIELLELSNHFKAQLLELLSDNPKFDFTSEEVLARDLLPLTQELIYASEELVYQSRKNIITTLDNYSLRKLVQKLVQKQEEGNTEQLDLFEEELKDTALDYDINIDDFDMLRMQCNKIMKLKDNEIKANLPYLVFDIMAIASNIEVKDDGNLSNSLAYLNKGL